MKERERIHKYAEELCRNKTFRSRLIQQMAIDIHLQLTKLKEEWASKNYDINTAIPYLERQLRNLFQEKEFWEQKAIWILSRLDAWSLEGKEPESLPNPFSWVEDKTSVANKRESYLINLCAFNTAGELLQKFNLPSLPVETLEQLLGLRKNTLPVTESQLFRQEQSITPIPTSALLISTGLSVVRPDQWMQDPNDFVLFLDNYRTGKIELFIKDLEPKTQQLIRFTGDSAWNIVCQFGLDTGLLHWTLAAYVFRSATPWKTEIKISGNDLIKTWGWNKRTDIRKVDKLKRIEQLAKLLRTLDATIKWDLGNLSCDGSYQIWLIDTELYGQRDILSEEIDNPTELILTVRTGKWAEFFLNQEGQKAKTALYEFGWLARETLKISPQRSRLASLLQLYLTPNSAIHTSGIYHLGKLLERAALPKKVITEARVDKRKAYDLKQQIYRGLEQMERDGWQIEGLERKKNLDQLLAQTITIKPKPEIQERLEKKTKPKQARKRKPAELPVIPEWADIQKACEARGWVTLTTIAKKLEVSQPLISQIKNGNRTISLQLGAKIREVLPELFVY